jgi:hypothetical protein
MGEQRPPGITGSAQAPIEFEGEAVDGVLRERIGPEGAVAPHGQQVRRIEPHHAGRHAAESDDAAARHECRKELCRQREVAERVAADEQLEPVGRDAAAPGGDHQPRVVDEGGDRP